MDLWIQTATGRMVLLTDPNPEMIDIMDIAHALSQLCRFTGHTIAPYSVAQHSIFVAQYMPRKHVLRGLFHDASEAYLSDISAPLKRLLPEYRRLEGLMMRAICMRFGLPFEEPEGLREVDLRMLATEKRDLFTAQCSQEWNILQGIEPYPERIVPWSSTSAEYHFLDWFHSFENVCHD